MKRKIIKWTLRLTAILLCSFLLVIIIVLNPTLLYANKTTFASFTVYHTKPLDTAVGSRLQAANQLLTASEIFDASFKMDICVDDGSTYPKLVRSFLGQAFGIGFYNKIVIYGNINWKDNFTEFNGYTWNLTQLLAHEAIHCLQFNKLGLLRSNPVANYPDWKWEGYSEYAARRNPDQLALSKNIDRLEYAETNFQSKWGVSFSDGTFTDKEYYKWWILVQYCKDIKEMSYLDILKDTTPEQTLIAEMLAWHNQRDHRRGTFAL